MECAAEFQSQLVEDVSGVDTVKAFGAERRRSDAADDRLVKVVQSIFSFQWLNASMNTIAMFLTGAAGIVVLWFGGHRVVEGALTIGQLMLFYTLLGFVMEPLGRLSTVNLQIQDALVTVDRLGEVLDLETENLPGEGRAAFRGVRDRIVLQSVRFRYGCRAEVIKGLDLEIPAGRTIAILGESGCGKSTLLKLLMRFCDPTEGRILVDGMDLRDLSLSSLRSRVGIVSQEVFLFSGTVRENIAFARPDASMEEVISAAKAAGLDEFVNTLPQRYDTGLGERGTNLSGGQRQRLAIARVFLADVDLVVFDEATSHLDSETEKAIQRSLMSRLHGKTVILVAHRLSTIRNADLICVMHEGRIVEQGTHARLMELDGRYGSLWKMQSVPAEEPLVILKSAEERNGTHRMTERRRA